MGEGEGLRAVLQGWREVEGWCTDEEGMYLYECARRLPSGSVVVEIGCWHGKSTIALALGCRESGSRVVSVDHLQGDGRVVPATGIETFSHNLVRFGVQDIVTLQVMDSQAAAERFGESHPFPSLPGLRDKGGVKVGLLYVDGSHEAEDVYGDLRAWLPHCREDAIILFHDYAAGWPGVILATGKAAAEGLIKRVQVVGDIGHFVRPGRGDRAPTEPRRVFWTILMERNLSCFAAQALVRIAGRCARDGFAYIALPYARTDDARNTACLALAKGMANDRDTLVMLDCDHEHPPDIVQRLVRHDVGVVGALYFRRSAPHDAMFFIRAEDGELQQPEEWDADTGIVAGTVVGTGAIAIQGWVFKRLMEKGFQWPFFRYTYTEEGMVQPTEDMYFGVICEEAGIPHYCDFSTVTPHLTTSHVDQKTFEAHRGEEHKVPSMEVEVEQC